MNIFACLWGGGGGGLEGGIVSILTMLLICLCKLVVNLDIIFEFIIAKKSSNFT